MIYLDAAATVAPSEGARERADLVLSSTWGNVSGAHEVSLAAKNLLEQARETCADLMMVAPNNIVFTSGATEALNIVLQGYFRSHPQARLFYSAIEHPAVQSTAEFLTTQGIHTHLIFVDENGVIKTDALEDVEQDDLVCVMPVNNETGVINDPENIAEHVHARGARLLLDCVQSFYAFSPHQLCTQADYAVFSGHKMGSLQGVGMLMIKDRKSISPLMFGGSQEWEIRPGTTPAYLCDSLSYVFSRNYSRRGELIANVEACRDECEVQLSSLVPSARIHSSHATRSPHIVSIDFPGVEAQMLVAMVDAKGICVSRGSACASGAATPSKVLVAMGIGEDKATSTLRLSFSGDTSRDDVSEAIRVIAQCVSTLTGETVSAS